MMKLIPSAKIVFPLFFATLLSACGGGGGSNSTNSNVPVQNNSQEQKENIPEVKPQPTIDYVTLKGGAHDDGSHFNFKVIAKCQNNSGFKQGVISDGNSKWEGEVDRTQLPCKLQFQSKDNYYHAYAFDEKSLVNINPFTDLIIATASQQSPAVWFESNYALTQDELKQTEAKIKNELIVKDYLIDEDTKLLTDQIYYAQPYYKALAMFKQALTDSKTLKNYLELTDLVKKGQIDAIPFAPEQYKRLNINFSVCSGVAYQGKTELLTHCSQELMSDFQSTKLKQKSSDECLIAKVGDTISLSSAGKSFSVRINQQAEDKITNAYPTMNTLILTEDNQRIEIVFMYDLLFLAAAYNIDSVGNITNTIDCK